MDPSIALCEEQRSKENAMGKTSWPTDTELHAIKKVVSEMSGRDPKDVRVVVSPYRICPLGAHIDHQGGTVSAMTINKGILLGFVPSNDFQVWLRSGQFEGDVRFRIDANRVGDKNGANSPSQQIDKCSWGDYARGALYALQSRGVHLEQGIIGYISGADGLDSSGLSSSAAVGIAYLLALENANSLTMSPTQNIEYDRVIENEYLGLQNGILDQSAILLSSYGCLTFMNCKTKEHKLVEAPKLQEAYKILLAFSGSRQALTTNPGYNRRVAECQEAAKALLNASGRSDLEARLCNVEPTVYEDHKSILEPGLAKRAKHYFSENTRVIEGLEAWSTGNLEDFGKLISASGLSSIENYECGAEPLIQLYEILLRAPGVYGARFSGAGFRGCCLAIVNPDKAEEAASFVRDEYWKLQPELASGLNRDTNVIICEAGDCARVL